MLLPRRYGGPSRPESPLPILRSTTNSTELNMKQTREQAIFAGLLVVLAVATRLLFNALHIFNFSAVMAAALFAGAYLGSKRMSLIIPLVAMVLTDLVIGVYDWKLMAVVDGV